MQQVKVNEATAAKRRLLFYLVAIGDGKTPYDSASGGQPYISTNGGTFTTTNVGTLTSIGHGHYYADVNVAALSAHAIITGFYSDVNVIATPSINALQVSDSDPYEFKSNFTLASIWAYSSRTLTALGSSAVASIWDALLSTISTSSSIGKLIKDNLDAAISTRSDFDSSTDGVTVASDGLDNVTASEFNGRAATFPRMVVALYMRFFNKVTQDATTQTIFRADNSTTAVSGTVSEASGVQTKGKLS